MSAPKQHWCCSVHLQRDGWSGGHSRLPITTVEAGVHTTSAVKLEELWPGSALLLTPFAGSMFWGPWSLLFLLPSSPSLQQQPRLTQASLWHVHLMDGG